MDDKAKENRQRRHRAECQLVNIVKSSSRGRPSQIAGRSSFAGELRGTEERNFEERRCSITARGSAKDKDSQIMKSMYLSYV